MRFQEAVRSRRAGARAKATSSRPGPPSSSAPPSATEFRGRDRAELLKAVSEPQRRGVPLRVNYSYPESKGLVEVPPSLLLRLPQLPGQVRYRFVGQNLLLVDRESGIVIDYIANALPGGDEPRLPTPNPVDSRVRECLNQAAAKLTRPPAQPNPEAPSHLP